MRPSCYCPAPPPCAEGHFCIRGDAAHRRRLAPRGKIIRARAKTRNNPAGAGSHPLPGVGLPPAPRRRSRPVGDGVPDVPLSWPPPALPSSASPDRACDDLAVYYAAHGPSPTRRRGRCPRRPFPSSTASPTAARRGCGRRGPPAKGEPPARVPPLTPSCASLSMGAFRALRRAARAPPLDPARFFVKKRGKKLLNASLHPTQAPRPWGE